MVDRLWQGCGIKELIPTVILLGISPFISDGSLWEVLFVVSQKWIPFPTTLQGTIGIRVGICQPLCFRTYKREYLDPQTTYKKGIAPQIFGAITHV